MICSEKTIVRYVVKKGKKCLKDIKINGKAKWCDGLEGAKLFASPIYAHELAEEFEGYVIELTIAGKII